MKKNRIILLLAVVLWLTSSVSAATIDRIAVRSEAMKKEIPVVVIVPDAAKSGVRMPVLYLLHGYSGDQETWLNVKPSLPQMADRDSVIVVCPDGENSWYWDSPKDPSSRFETFVARELIDYVDAHYPTRGDRSGRAITGLSMGGHGGLWLSFRHKDTFGAGGSTSGGVDIRPFPENWEMAKQLGEEATNRKTWDDHTVMTQLDSISNGDLALVIDCGYDDFFFDVNNKLHEALRERGIEHDYTVRPGVHNGPYWTNSIDYQWLFFKKFFDHSGRSRPTGLKEIIRCPSEGVPDVVFGPEYFFSDVSCSVV